MGKETTFGTVARSLVYQQVAEELRAAILRGDLAPGDEVPTERDLSEQFGVSRPTIREALRTLHAEGLLDGGGRRGSYRRKVVDNSEKTVRTAIHQHTQLRQVPLRDLVELRVAIESSALRRAAANPDPDAMDVARATLTLMRRPRITVEAFEEADVRFHLALVAASGNAAMHAVMLGLRDAMAEHLLTALRKRRRSILERLADEHAAILKAVEAGDGDRAAALVTEHIMDFYKQNRDG